MASKSLNVKVPRLGRNRHGVYYVRSSALNEAGKRRVSQQSLHTKDPHLAKILALKFCLALAQGMVMKDPREFMGRYDLDLPGGKASASDPEDHKRMMEAINALTEARIRLAALGTQPIEQNAAQTVAVTPSPPPLTVRQYPQMPSMDLGGPTLKDALDAHLADETRKALLKPQTLVEKKTVYQDFADLFGPIMLNQVRRADVTTRWRAAEFSRPNKKFEGKTLGLNRLEKRRGYLSKFFNYAIEGGLYFYDHPIKLPMATKAEIKSTQSSYAEFSSDDLKVLFSPRYLVNMHKPDWYWIPLMSLLSGARLSELADLPLQRITEIEGIKVFRIDSFKVDKSVTTSVKTVASKRTVPIHSTLLDLGFWEYVESLKNRNETHLLPHRPASKRSKSVGGQWGKWITRCGFTNDQMVFHSFRSTAITDLHNSDATHGPIRETTGHATAGTSGTHGDYVRGLKLINLKATIEKLAYPTVDFAALKLADPTFSAYFASLKVEAQTSAAIERSQRLENHKAAKAEREARLAKTRKRKAKVIPTPGIGSE